MAHDIRATLLALKSHLTDGGYVAAALIGEPTQPLEVPTGALFASIRQETQDISDLTLATSIGIWTVRVRFHARMFIDASVTVSEATEIGIAAGVSDFLSSLAAAFTLGGEIQAVDFGGSNSGGVTTDFGHLDLNGTMFRIADVTVPMIVNDDQTFTA